MLSIEGLTKRYGQRTALDGLNLQLPAAQWVALLGPNGAGKSTLFQVLTGLFAPDEGQVRLDGVSLQQRPTEVLARIGVVFQQMSLDLDLSVRRNLLFHADLHGMPRASALQRIDELGASLGVTDNLDRSVRELSGGNRRKVELVRALMHEPALLLMDEPTVGLDPPSRRDLMRAISDAVRQRATTVLWATHLVEEAQAADRVLVLHKGRLLADGAPADVTRTLGGQTLEDAFIQATRTHKDNKP